MTIAAKFAIALIVVALIVEEIACARKYKAFHGRLKSVFSSSWKELGEPEMSAQDNSADTWLMIYILFGAYREHEDQELNALGRRIRMSYLIVAISLFFIVLLLQVQ